MHDAIAILDFGSQTAQLIARRVREAQVYSELFPWDAEPETVMALQPRGFILSGGPASVYEPGAPQIPAYVLDSGRPILGICYGMQALTHALGGRVAPSARREFGQAWLEPLAPNGFLPSKGGQVWMSHGDRIDEPPPGFTPLAQTDNAPIAAMGDLQAGRYGVQFHPEVRHTTHGAEMLRRFALEVCGAAPDWTPASIIHEVVGQVREQVGGERVLAAVSGGVDSSVATALVHQAVGEQLVAVFVDTGMLRSGEAAQVAATFRGSLGVELVTVDGADDFMSVLQGISDPEEKRRAIGEQFIRIFETQARQLGAPPFLVQGTIYPDVVESSAPDRAQAARIKTHHNVGGLPDDLHFDLVEPLRYLFKDEVRAVGEALGLSHEQVWRQPFPGPGLAVRCLGEVTRERLARLRAADHIFTEALNRAGLMQSQPSPDAGDQDPAITAQAFAVLLPVRSVGVMGDQRTYQEVVALRAVSTDDFMTADWSRLPHELLADVANRIVNEVSGINRVVFDVTSKPPGTIEWE